MSYAGNVCLAMGRSKIDTACIEGAPAFTDDFEYGKVSKVRCGTDVAFLALGAMTQRALKAAEQLAQQGVNSSVYAVSCPLAVSDDTLREAFAHGAVITIEDHNVSSGMGALWLARACELGLSGRVRRIGVSRYGDSGPSDQVYAAMGLSPEAIASTTLSLLRTQAE